MIIFYILLSAYILAVNFYAFLLVKTLRDEETQAEIDRQSAPIGVYQTEQKPPQKSLSKLIFTGFLGGAVTIYASMFILKYKRGDLLLMVLMPVLGVLNIYLFVMLFKNGLPFLLIR